MFKEALYLFADGLMYRIDIERAVDDKEALWIFFNKLFIAVFYLSVNPVPCAVLSASFPFTVNPEP